MKIKQKNHPVITIKLTQAEVNMLADIHGALSHDSIVSSVSGIYNHNNSPKIPEDWLEKCSDFSSLLYSQICTETSTYK